MKRIYFYLTLFAVIFTSCDPLEEIYEDIDAEDDPVVANVEYTLTDDDYEELGLEFGTFDSEEQAKNLLPAFLSDKYPFYGEGSSVVVGYDLFRGRAEGVDDFTSADSYTLTNDDYASTGSDAFGFYPDTDATDEIPAILDTAIESPTDGQLLLVEYDQYFETPEVGLANIYEASFPADFGSFEIISVSGPQELGWNEDTGFIVGNGFQSGPIAVEEWIISPEVDLTGQSDLLFQITQEIDFLGDEDLIDILVSTNYTTGGNVGDADWEALEFDKTAFGDMMPSENLDFSDYDGETVHIALKYSSTDEDSSRWRVQSFAVRTLGVSGETDGKGEYFRYDAGDSAWEDVEDVIYLSDSDFDSMGEEFGQPGRFNNFSSSVRPENYLPQFLALEYPFAQEDDELFVIYRYFSSSSGAQLRGDFYTFDGEDWSGFDSVVSTSLQFGFEDGMWVPDNTIRYTFAASDYTLVGEELANEPGFESAASSASRFGNFDRRSGGTSAWSDEMMLRAISVVLNNINPSAEEGQKYIVTVDTFIGSSSTETFNVIKEGGEWVYQD